MLRLVFVVFGLVGVLAACGGGGGNVAPPNGGNGGLPPTPFRVYVANGSSSGTVEGFELPVSPSSSPVVNLAVGNTPLGIGIDPANRLFILSDFNIFVFTNPISNNDTPALDLVTNTDGQAVAFDSNSNAYVSRCTFVGVTCNSVVDVYTAPIAASSKPSFDIAIGAATRAHGLAFDRNGDLWVSVTPDSIGGIIHDEMVEFVPPFSASSTAAVSFNTATTAQLNGVSFDTSGNMYLNGPDSVDVYKPPFSAGTTKAFSIATSPTNSIEGFSAFDAQGRLYVTVSNGTGPGQLLVFDPPLNASSVPTVQLPISPNATGVAIGH